jgi:hypothetical protein
MIIAALGHLALVVMGEGSGEGRMTRADELLARPGALPAHVGPSSS